jgi:hypothetical protein
MNNPSNIDEREKIETENARWGLISSMKSLNSDKVFYNDFFIYKEILKLSDNEVLDLMKNNLIQQNDLNPFAFFPEDKRPEGYQILDQLKNPPQPEESTDMGMEGGMEETPPQEEEIPTEVQDQFGPPPEEMNQEEEENIEPQMGPDAGEEMPLEGEDEYIEPQMGPEAGEEAPTPELASYSFREKRKNVFLEKQKSMSLKNKVIKKIINEDKIEKEKEIKITKEKETKEINSIYEMLNKIKKQKSKKPKKNFSLEYIENNNEFMGLNKIISKNNTFFD